LSAAIVPLKFGEYKGREVANHDYFSIVFKPGSRHFPLASWARPIGRALACWRERRRAKADLARLAEAGDYLLRDVGLDPKLARENPGALVDQVIRREE
jgi:uncharacterized protein YjiS (DUF1127 family)